MAVPCILGIDPGYGRIGYGIIFEDNRNWRYAAHGCIETDASAPFVDRLHHIHIALTEMIQKYPITHGAVEELFFYKNVTTGIDVGQARGVILLSLIQAGLPVLEFTPLQIKQALTGYGKADKKQIQQMVEITLQKKFTKTLDDAIDGLAIALTASTQLKTYKK